MKKRLNIIKKIEYTRSADVTSYSYSENGLVKIETNQWRPIPKGNAPAMLNVEHSDTDSGDLYNVSLSFNLLEKLNETAPIILKVEFCDSEPMLIGSPELPVHLSGSNSLTSKNISLSHQSWHEPFQILIE